VLGFAVVGAEEDSVDGVSEAEIVMGVSDAVDVCTSALLLAAKLAVSLSSSSMLTVWLSPSEL
jgi:hypothetical protein